jgi:hypothetical protein
VALPSAVTLGSVALVVAAGVGLAAVASNASEDPAPRQPAAHETATPDTSDTSKPDEPKPEKKPEKKPKQAARPDPVPKVFVEVYNNSGITGLAGQVADRATDMGWQVVGSDNWYGTIPATTVYYPERLKRAAKTLALDLGIQRTALAIDPMRRDRLTLILTAPLD